jgi:threonine-phosphate decarboxylase
MKEPIHGGRLMEMDQGGFCPLDFSVNLNPWGPPSILREQWSSWFRYVSLYPPLSWSYYQHRLARLYGFPEENILPLNGATQGIYCLARCHPARKAVVLEPCFTEYTRALTIAGKEVVHFWCVSEEQFSQLLSLLDREMPGLVVMGNPGNPLGICLPDKMRCALYQWCRERNSTLVVDEAFQEFIQEKTSFFQWITDDESLIVVRSLTKYYALAGLRGGFLLGGPSLLKSWLSTLEPWNINSLFAVTLDLLANSDLSDYHTQTRQRLMAEKDYLEDSWKQFRDFFELLPSQVNFYTVKIMKGDPARFYPFMREQGLVVRPLDDFWGMSNAFFRFAVRTHDENQKLIEVITNHVRSL